MNFKNFFLSCLVAGALVQAGVSGAAARWEEPWGKARTVDPGERAAQNLSLAQRTAGGLIGIFRDYISPVDGDRCPMVPTCSQYGIEAVRRHGAAIGFVMAFDRLMHESDEMRRAPQVKVYDSYRYYDPVENNDFWWNKMK